VELLRDRPVSRSAIKAALHVLVRTTAWGRNRIKAVDITGTVPVPVDMLFDDGVERRACELVLAALDMLFDDATERRACELVLTAAARGAVPKRVTTAMLGTRQFWCLNRGYWEKKMCGHGVQLPLWHRHVGYWHLRGGLWTFGARLQKIRDIVSRT
jgi:hypothetical protein